MYVVYCFPQRAVIVFKNELQSFSEFDIEYTEGCDKDYVEIRDGRDPSVSLGRYCGQTIPTNISVAQSMYVKFRSDKTNQLSGFAAQFSACEYSGLMFF